MSRKYKLSVPVTILKEGKSYIAWSPALDLSTVGDTVERAQKMFSEAAELFFEEIRNKGTLEDVLLDLGWRKNKDDFMPPIFVAQKTQEFVFSTSS